MSTPQPWRDTHTLMHPATDPIAAVQGAHKKLDEMFADWRARKGATALRIISTQLLPYTVKQEVDGVKKDVQLWMFLITWEIEGVEQPVARGKAKP